MPTSLLEFAPKKNKTQVFLDRYQYILSMVATFLFFSDLPDYILSSGLAPLPPLVWIWVFVILSIPFAKKILTMPKPLTIAMIVYMLISVLSLVFINGDEVSMQEFRNRALSVLFVCLMYVLYEQRSLRHIKYVILAVMLMNVTNNLLELLVNPKLFVDLGSGRPAGFYVNPNKAGCAFILGLIVTISIVKQQYRWFYILFVGVGCISTFSRGSILGWLICLLFLIMGRVLSEKRRSAIVPTIVLVLFLIVLNPVQTFSGYLQGGSDSSWDVLNRLEQFQNPSLEDDSANERKAVVRFAWVMFAGHPFLGNGLGSTKKWTVSEVSTHNMYLYYMTDHGIIGVIFLPGAIFAVIYRNRGEQPVIILCFIVFMSLWGIFSHNVLEERYILSIFALFAAMTTNQNWYLKYTNRNFQQPLPINRQLILPPTRK